MRATFPQVAKDFVDRYALVHAGDWPDDALEGLAAVAGNKPANEILGVQHADDVVDRVTVDGQPRVGTLGDEANHVIERSSYVDGGDLRARHHQLFGLSQIQAKSAPQAAMLVRLQKAAVTALG